MDWVFKPADTSGSFIPLSLLKSFLRITKKNISEDEKIKHIINSSVDFFEKKTGFLLRAGELILTFSFEDNFIYPATRSKYNYLDKYSKDYYSALKPYRDEYGGYYSPPLACSISTQKPTSLEFQSRGKITKLTGSEIETLLPDNFFTVTSERPLQFSLSQDLKDLREKKDFEEFSEDPIKLGVTVANLETEYKDIEKAIVRMCLKEYENPDSDVNFVNDSIISEALLRYNCTVGL